MSATTTSALYPFVSTRCRAGAISLGCAIAISTGALALGGCPDVPQVPPTQAVVAEFDPTHTDANGNAAPIVPTPTDLALVGGHPQFPDAPNASPAQKELNDYIRSLDGFPAESPATALFSGPVDAATVAPLSTTGGSVLVFDATARMPLGPSAIAPALSSDGKTLTVRPAGGVWSLGHTYAVLVFGSSDPAGLKGQGGLPVVAAPFTYFVRGRKSLLRLCDPNVVGDGGVSYVDNDDGGADDVDGGVQDDSEMVSGCDCPYDADDDVFDSRCTPSSTGVSLGQATQLERIRRQLAPLLDATEAVTGRKREGVVLAWTFTIAHGPFVEFDPTRGLVPFPNDALVDQVTHKVHLPISMSDPPAQQALKMGLNQLDGFSTTAAETAPIATADDTAGAPPQNVKAGKSALLIDATNLGNQPTYTAAPRLVNGGKDYVGTAAPGTGLVELVPTRPLYPDHEQYLAVLTDQITDAKGRPLRPSPVMRLVMAQSPLYDAAAKHSLVDVLSDDQAAQLEQLRAAYARAGLFDQLQQLLGVARADLAAVWTFSTQTETKPLLDLAGYPAKAKLSTAVTIDDVESGSAYGPDVGAIAWGTMHTHVALSAQTGLLDLTGGQDVDVPFVLLAPASAPSTGAPVTIVQHGLGGWRGDVRFLAEAFAKQGIAVIGIDIDFHGARSACTADADCSGGGKCSAGACSTSLAPAACTRDASCAGGAGSCNTTSGICTGGLAPTSDLCMTHLRAGNAVTECKPLASGKAFLDLTNPFATRDHFRQHVLDLSQLVRVVADTSPTGLQAQLAAAAPTPIAIDVTPSKLAYLGVSLGAIEGTLFLAASPSPTVGVLNVPGGRLVDVLVTSPTFSKLLAPLLTANNIAPDTGAYDQLLDTYRWIMDPGDPINFGRNLVREPLAGNPSKSVIVQEAGADMVIPNPWTDALAVEIGVPFVGGHPGIHAPLASMPQAGPMDVSTFFPGAAHGFLFGGDAETDAGRLQATTWIASGGTLVTAP